MITFVILMAVNYILNDINIPRRKFYFSDCFHPTITTNIVVQKEVQNLSLLSYTNSNFFPNNQCLLIVFITALLLAFHPLIHLIPMQY